MKLEALDHPKTYDFAARLNVSRPTAIGHLELLWAFVAQKAPQGNVGKWPDGAIARACDWMGDPAQFVGALRDAGLIDSDSKHRLIVHDWAEHAPRWVKLKLQKMKLDIVASSTEPTIEPSIEPTAEPSSRVEKGSLEKPRVEIDARAIADRLQAIYPEGTYGAQNWLLAEREIGKLLDAGEPPDDLERLTREYRTQCDAKGSTGTQFIRSPEKFYGAGFWRGPFPLPPPLKSFADRQADGVRERFLKGTA